ncbi:MAG: MFS transporter [Clostridia bacterium]|nr:MFS transporter [Clostridia bacterium]
MHDLNDTGWRKTFFTIWSGQAFSLITTAIVQYAIIWHITATTGSAMILSLAAIAAFLPQGILGPIAGVYVDRWNRKTIMIIADSSIALISLILAIVGLMGSIPIWLIMVVLFLRSIGSAFHYPALTAITPMIVPKDQLVKCGGYTQTMQSVSFIISPALAAFFYAKWILPAIILLDILGAAVAVFALALSKIPPLPTKTNTEKPHMVKEAVDGFKVLKANDGLLGLTLISALFFLGLMPAATLFPLITMSYFGGTTFHASIAEITYSVGMLLGSLILGIWGGTKNKMITITASTFIVGLTFTLSGLLPPTGFAVFAVYSGIMGLVSPYFTAVFTALLQQKIAPEFLGRVLSLSTSIIVLASPIGLALAGVFAEKLGVPAWFVISGIVVIFASLLCIIIPSVRNCDKPTDKLQTNTQTV